ncbi:hypothetical protein TH9_15905 [Thalassospira xiamenensis]|nr:hypothetical protein TH9_15905 [Thalassospira xiamenensis]
MTGEVRLFEEEALNLPGAAAMAAAGSVERGLSMVDRWGPYARSVSGLHRLREVLPLLGEIGAGRGPGDRQLARMADARGVFGLPSLPESCFGWTALPPHRSSAGGARIAWLWFQKVNASGRGIMTQRQSSSFAKNPSSFCVLALRP